MCILPNMSDWTVSPGAASRSWRPTSREINVDYSKSLPDDSVEITRCQILIHRIFGSFCEPPTGADAGIIVDITNDGDDLVVNVSGSYPNGAFREGTQLNTNPWQTRNSRQQR